MVSTAPFWFFLVNSVIVEKLTTWMRFSFSCPAFWAISRFWVGDGNSMTSWRAAYCEGRRELYARDHLVERGFEVFCPFEKVTRRRKMLRQAKFTVETVNIPVFPNYLFVRSAEYLAVERTPGVSGVVKAGGVPLVVPDLVIDLLRAAADAEGMVAIKDVSRLSFGFAGKVGDSFTFKRNSPLSGLLGRISSLAALDETGMVKAFVEMFGAEREVSVSHLVVGGILPRTSTSVAASASY